jgi:hypothetical protein
VFTICNFSVLSSLIISFGPPRGNNIDHIEGEDYGVVRRKPYLLEEHIASIFRVEAYIKEGTKISTRQTEHQLEAGDRLSPPSAGFMFRLHFYPEDGSNASLRNVGLFFSELHDIITQRRHLKECAKTSYINRNEI